MKKEKNKTYCDWIYAPDKIMVKTECRHLYCGGVAHTYNYCPWCGKPINLKKDI
jgi:hypothetical protein